MDQFIALFVSFGVPLLVVVLTYVIFRYFQNKKKLFLNTLKLRLLSIRLAQKLEGEKRDLMQEIGFSSQLFSLLSGLKIPFSLETAVHNVGEDINFYIAVPEASLGFAAKQIQGLWADAQVQKVDDYTIFNSQGAVRAGFLKLKQHYAIPIRTFAETTIDTFLPILSNFSKLELTGEGMALQVLVRPASEDAKKSIMSSMFKLKKGEKLSDILHPGFMSKILPKKKPRPDEKPEPIIIDEESIKLLNQKVAKPLFEVNIRLIASAPSAYQAEEILFALTGSFNQFTAPLRNEFKVTEPRNLKDLVFKYVFREFNESQSVILNSDEIASVWHLPTSLMEIPRIKWVKSKEAAPPPSVLPDQGMLIGESVFRGESRPIFVTDEDRRRHIYVVGQTGTGKSTALFNMAAGDIKAGKGIAVVDPHGELIEQLLGLIPEERLKDVVLFDPGDMQYPLGLNMLEYDPNRPEEKTFIVNEMQSIFNKLFNSDTMGPMFEQYMRNALLLLMDDPNEHATLMEVPRIFVDAEYRKRLLQKATNPTVIDFWEKEAVKAGGEASLANMTPYITSKFNNFISNDYLRPIIGQPTSSLNFRKIMDEGKILLVNLSKGKIGDINAGLLGMVVVGKILLAALSRVDTQQEERKDFTLYIDEFQNFTTDSIATILSEARKYRLSLVVAHQFIGQLSEKIRDAVFGNVGSQVVFRVGAEDAEFLVKQFEPVFTKNDLLNIDNFHAFVKLLIKGQTAKPFNVHIFPPMKGNLSMGQKVKDLSRATYGRDRQMVELDVLKRLRG
ncbi:MAG: type IV secretion system DNA-binding domain-containing protein [bacterium]|nr:type IV secretion system DNA-binding domain-containing protein [bacterium]